MIKWMLPKPAKIAEMAAKAAKDAINSLPEDHAAKIAKASEISSQANECLSAITRWLADGKMDDEEEAQLARALEPLVKSIMEKI